MASRRAPTLKALVVFRNGIFEEVVRTVHVYEWGEDVEEFLEREYAFHERWDYEELWLSRKVFIARIFDVSEQHVGMVNGSWKCIFVFDRDLNYHLPVTEFIPELLLTSRNHKLASIPTLANDLDFVFHYIFDRTDALWTLPEERGEVQNNVVHLPQTTQRTAMFDLISLPDPEFDNKESDPKAAGVVDKKQKRAATRDISRLALEDLAKYFDLPIVEASKNLKVGLTVLKKKCREFGIPRWPHRKIKSLNGLIHNLQEEAKRQEEDEAAAMAVAKRQRMIESEKESIERKPFLDIQKETKRFRQDIFKRRHITRVLESQSLTTSLV